MAYKVSKKDTEAMKRLMKKIEDKKFNENDKEELSKLTARFLFFTSSLSYTDGYTLVD